MTVAVYQRIMAAVAVTDAAANAAGVQMLGLPFTSGGKPNGKTWRLYKYTVQSRFFTTNGTYAALSLAWVSSTGIVTQRIVSDLIGVVNNAASTDAAEPTTVVHEWPEGRIISPVAPGNGGVNNPYCIGMIVSANQAGVGLYELQLGGDWDWGSAQLGLNVFDLGDNP